MKIKTIKMQVKDDGNDNSKSNQNEEVYMQVPGKDGIHMINNADLIDSNYRPKKDFYDKDKHTVIVPTKIPFFDGESLKTIDIDDKQVKV